MYHVNPATGIASRCRARIRCRFGEEQDHYGSVEEAREAYETQRTSFVKKKSFLDLGEIDEINRRLSSNVNLPSNHRIDEIDAVIEANATTVFPPELYCDFPEELLPEQIEKGLFLNHETYMNAITHLPDNTDKPVMLRIACMEGTRAVRIGDGDSDEHYVFSRNTQLQVLDDFTDENNLRVVSVRVVPENTQLQAKYDWPAESQNRTLRSPRGEIFLQIGECFPYSKDERPIEAWLTTPDGETRAFIKVLAQNQFRCTYIGEHLAMSDIETRLDSRGQGYARELRETIESEFDQKIYSSGGYTPEGWAAFGEHGRYLPNPYQGTYSSEEPGPRYRSMGFVASWKGKLSRDSHWALDLTDEQQDAAWELSQSGFLRKLEDKEILWATE